MTNEELLWDPWILKGALRKYIGLHEFEDFDAEYTHAEILLIALLRLDLQDSVKMSNWRKENDL